MHEADLESVEWLNSNIAVFWLKTDEKLEYIAGQFTQIELEHTDKDERGHKRWFTLVSSPTEGLLGFCTRIPEKPSSFKRQLSNLKPGKKLLVGEAMGDFVLPQIDSIPLVFICAGIGATPFRSMVKYLKDNQESRNITLMHTASNESDLIFSDFFESSSIDYLKFIKSRQTDNHTIKSKIVNSAKEKYSGDSNTLIYISGPEKMVEDYRESLLKVDVNENNILTDYFLNLN